MAGDSDLIAYLEEQKAEREAAHWERMRSLKIAACVVAAIVVALVLTIVVFPHWLEH